MRFLHLADLHLSEKEKEYSLGVWSEVVGMAKAQKADAILLSGDIFDTFSDLEKLKSDFLKRLSIYQGSVFYIPGNHEDLRKGKGSLESMAWERIDLIAEKPFGIRKLEVGGESVEILGLPFQKEYSDWTTWEVPAKECTHRICMAHGTIPEGVSYTGPSEEEDNSELDSELFRKIKADYVALGHIHKSYDWQTPDGTVLFSYPGSSRVWRKGEVGKRRAVVWDTKFPRKVDSLFLDSAGQNRVLAVPLDLNGNPPDLEKQFAGFGKFDSVELRWSGLVEDEKIVESAKSEAQKQFSKVVRELRQNSESVLVLSGIASNSLARKFLSKWQSEFEKIPAEESETKELYLASRQIALEEIKKAVGA